MTQLVEQHVSGWDDWPADVVERLREWNSAYLLSFRHGQDYRCEGGCARMIASHARGNPVVRPTKKSPGTPVCEDCLIAFARKFTRPPRLGLHGAIQKLNRKLARQSSILVGLQSRNRRLRRQITVGEAYIDRLEALVSPDDLMALKNDLRGHYRAPGGA